MRGVWVGLIGALLLLSASGWRLYYFQREASQSGLIEQRLRETRSQFLRTHFPLHSLSLAELPHDRELWRNENLLPRSHDYSPAALRQIEDFSRACTGPLPATADRLEKTRQWARFLCRRAGLPARFFDRAPWMHFSGKSFAQLAVESGRPEFKSEIWRRDHQSAFHLLEQKRFPWLDYDLLEGLNRNSTTLVNQSLIGFAASGSERKPNDVFHFYSLAHWDAAVRESWFQTAAQAEGQDCLIVENGLCWRFHPDRARAEQFAGWLVFLSGVALAGGAVYLLWDRQRMAGRARESRHFLLQTLTHELRTPVTTLQLAVEAFRREFNSLTPSGQTSFLRLTDEVQRLSRLVHASAKYLSADSPDFRLEPQEIPSVEDAVREWVAPYGDAVKLLPAEKDGPLVADPYWLHLCVKNLVENAFRHGTAPVTVRWEWNHTGLTLSVIDCGEISFKSWGKNGGMGMGLSIVKQVIERMNGTLSFRAQPTQFTLSLRSAIHGEASLS